MLDYSKVGAVRLREFLRKTEPICYRIVRNSPTSLGSPIYSLAEWAMMVTPVALVESMMPGNESMDVDFLFRPLSRRSFWAFAKNYQLPAFESLGSSALGLLMRLGEAWKPRAVVYELTSAKMAYTASFREPVSANPQKQKRRVHLDFMKNVIDLDLGESRPVFVKYASPSLDDVL